MRKTYPGLLIFTVLLLTITSCNLPINNSVEEPTLTFLLIQVTDFTAYRTGPGENYDQVGILAPGLDVEAVGRSIDGTYWLIRDPGNPLLLYWLDGENIIFGGDLNSLPILTPESTPPQIITQVSDPQPTSGCPTPIGGGPTPVNCSTSGDPIPSTSGCPTPVGGGPTPVSCSSSEDPIPSTSGCPTPVGGGPTPVSCSGSTATIPSGSGCPTPVGGGPTPVSCSGSTVPIPSGSGCPTPVGGGPTPVSCSVDPIPSGSGCPTPVGGGPTPVSCTKP